MDWAERETITVKRLFCSLCANWRLCGPLRSCLLRPEAECCKGVRREYMRGPPKCIRECFTWSCGSTLNKWGGRRGHVVLRHKLMKPLEMDCFCRWMTAYPMCFSCTASPDMNYRCLNASHSAYFPTCPMLKNSCRREHDSSGFRPATCCTALWANLISPDQILLYVKFKSVCCELKTPESEFWLNLRSWLMCF